MDWNNEQLNTIRETYWQRGRAECPTCNRVVHVSTEPVPNNDRRAIVAGCPVCKVHYRITPDTDPQAGTFRPWSDDERKQLLVGFGKGSPVCPVDGTMLDATDEPVPGSPVVGQRMLVIRCGRCGQSCAEKR